MGGVLLAVVGWIPARSLYCHTPISHYHYHSYIVQLSFLHNSCLKGKNQTKATLHQLQPRLLKQPRQGFLEDRRTQRYLLEKTALQDLNLYHVSPQKKCGKQGRLHTRNIIAVINTVQ